MNNYMLLRPKGEASEASAILQLCVIETEELTLVHSSYYAINVYLEQWSIEHCNFIVLSLI